MRDATAEFFASLPERGVEPLLQKASGVIRFDLVHGKKTDHWLVKISKGKMRVSNENTPADCALKTDKALFEAVARGQANALASTLRGAVTLTAHGARELEVLMLFQRLFPGPQSAGVK